MNYLIYLLLLIIVYVVSKFIFNYLNDNQSTGGLSKQDEHEIALLTGRKKARVNQRWNSISLNKDDSKFVYLRQQYRLSWQFAHYKAGVNYNGFSCTQSVIDASKENVKKIRTFCKNKYGIDIHLELMGVASSQAPIS